MVENQDWASGFKRFGHQLEADLEKLQAGNEDLNNLRCGYSSYNDEVKKLSDQLDDLRNESHMVRKNPGAKEILEGKMDGLSEKIGETLDGVKEEYDEFDGPLVEDENDADVIEDHLSKEG